MDKLLTNITNITTSTELVLLLSASAQVNCSSWEQRWGAPYMQRLSHLDVQLYQDFYALWISLMVGEDTALSLGEKNKC